MQKSSMKLVEKHEPCSTCTFYNGKCTQTNAVVLSNVGVYCPMYKAN